MTVLAELDTATHRNILEAVANGAQLPAVANQERIDIRIVRAIACDAGFPDLGAVRVALARLKGPRPRRAPPAAPDPEETDHPAVALAAALHAELPDARPDFLANLDDRAQLEQVVVFLAAMLPAVVRPDELTLGALAIRFAVRSRDPHRIRATLDGHDALSLCELAGDLTDSLPAELDPVKALAWCEQD